MGKDSDKSKIEEELTFKRESAWAGYESSQEIAKMASDYMRFLDMSKTERACAKTIIAELKKAGFKDIDSVETAKPGDRLYQSYKSKVVAAIVVGKDMSRFQIIGSHIDSPRIDLKPSPMYEDSGLALLKSHYYGGIKKYQWVNVPLAMYGLAHTKSGQVIEFSYGEREDEPKFTIPDLLPHLARKQMEKTAKEFIEGEDLNIIIGNIPIDDKKVKDKVKTHMLQILNRQFGLIEEDFHFAEIQFVPAGKSFEIGFDRSMIGGYGQDDKVCTYATLRAVLDTKAPKTTVLAYFSDKEEIGSEGDTGAQSFYLLNLAESLMCRTGQKGSPSSLLFKSKAISADVSDVVNPNFSDVHEKMNAALLGHGVIIEKYTGSGGKYSANDASAEYMNYIRKILQEQGIKWQTGVLGKIDLGGGGTIAKFLSRFGIDTVDAGPGVLAMHAPVEVVSKVDIYETYRLYKAFANK